MQGKKIKVAYFQFALQHDRQTDLQRIENALKKVHCDLLVLPELTLCRYLFTEETNAKVAERVPEGVSTGEFALLSQKYHCAIIFGLIEKDGLNIYDTAVLVSDGRYCGKYRKIHLSDYEKRFFKRGRDNKLLTLGEIKLGVQICFDLWFPEVSREQAAQGAELFCALAGFGKETTSLIAPVRAIENLTPLVMCNRIGQEQNKAMDAYFCGKSMITKADGERFIANDKEAVFAQEIILSASHANIICRDFKAEIALHN